MPKSSKKRKEKAADFAKAKLKLGKGRKPPSNEIDTSFKARSVALPNQTIRTKESVAEQSAPTTRRRLTYEDLLVHLRHYSPATRKEALQGLRELLSEHPALVLPNLGSLLGTATKLITDDDQSVRKSLITFLEWVLDQVSADALAPHTPPLVLFGAAALAHISPSVRDDAVRVIGALLEKIPQAVVLGASVRDRGEEGPGVRILEGLMAALGAGGLKGTDNTMSLTSVTKLTFLATLLTFLQHMFSEASTSSDPRGDSFPTWYFASAFPSTSVFESFVTALSLPRCRNVGHIINRFDLAFGSVGHALESLQIDDFDHTQASPSAENNKFDTLVHRLHPVIIATFLDNAPQLRLDTSASPASVELVLRAVELARIMYGNAIRNGVPSKTMFESLSELLEYMATYFPFEETVRLRVGETVDIKTQEAVQSLSILHCELVSLFTSRPPQLQLASRKRRRQILRGVGSDDEFGRRLLRDVADYVIGRLCGQVGSTPSLAPTLPHTAYMTLLPTLWALREEPKVLSAILEHATSASGKSKAIKRASIEFVGRIVLLESDPRCQLSLGVSREAIDEWVTGLPRIIWEFGDKELRGSEVGLLVLLRMNQRRLFNKLTLTSLQQRFVPFFMIDHATRGSLAGPWAKLPRDIQKLALDLVSSLCSINTENTSALTSAVERAVTDKQLLDYWETIRSVL